MKKPLTKSIRTLYGIGDFGFSLMASLETFTFTYFLTNIAQLPLAIATAILLITSSVDAVLSPIYGGIINSTRAMKWGRYRSWLLVCPPLVVVFYAFMYTKIGTDLTASIIICIGFLASHIIWNLAWVANISLVSVLANNSDERALLSSRRATYTGVSKLLVSYTSLPFALWLGTTMNSPTLGFTIAAVVLALVYMVAYYVHFFLTKGYEKEISEKLSKSDAARQEKTDDGDKARISEILKNLFLNPPLMFLMVADFTRYLSSFIMNAILAYYYTYVIGDMGYFSVFILVSTIFTTVGSYFSGMLCTKFSTRTTTVASMLLFSLTLIGSKFVAFYAIPFIVVMSIAQMFYGILYSSIVALYGDTVVYGEWKTGKNTAGFIMGIMNFPLKLSIIARTAIIGIALGAAGFSSTIDPAQASDALKNGIVNAFVLIPGVAVFISFVILLFGFKLTKEKLATYQADIDQRKKSELKSAN